MALLLCVNSRLMSLLFENWTHAIFLCACVECLHAQSKQAQSLGFISRQLEGYQASCLRLGCLNIAQVTSTIEDDVLL